MYKRIAIIGGGPSALFLFKTFLDSQSQDFSIDIFEATGSLGLGMPYSANGANQEHVTNVSGNEIPMLVTSVKDWMKGLSTEKLEMYSIDLKWFNEYMVMPRLLFGEYLRDQFDLLIKKAEARNIVTNVHTNCRITDIVDLPDQEKVKVEMRGHAWSEFDSAVICTGHVWPMPEESRIRGFFNSPYPPSKLKMQLNHTVAVRGSSLTAIDAIRTLSRTNGTFIQEKPHQLFYKLKEGSENFKIAMFSRHGLLPGIRFHLDDPHLSKTSLLSKKEIEEHIRENDGFLSLDYIFEKDFKEVFRKKDPSFYEYIRSLTMEEFVNAMMSFREAGDPFVFFEAEYNEAQRSISERKSVYWKEALAVLSFAMNYPAKHFSAEDMLRLQQTLMPLISIIIAFVPQRSCEELIALHQAAVLELFSVGDESEILPVSEGGIKLKYTDEAAVQQEKQYLTYIDCSGQKHLQLQDFPFESLKAAGTIREASLAFRSREKGMLSKKQGNSPVEEYNGNICLLVPGIAIDDSFRVIETGGLHNPRIHMMAVSFMGGLNPDYSGLDFCEEASGLIVRDVLNSN